jgi:thioredoxin reductase
MEERRVYDVIIIGGSYAGLSAALTLGRSLRRVLIIDSGKPCNKSAPYSHNFLTQDGIPPAEILSRAKKQVLLYPTVEFKNGIVIDVQKTESGFTTLIEDGIEFASKKILFASGIIDIMPAIPGFSDCWGISILHCPYCHGYEEREKHTAVFANGEHAMHVCMVLLNLTKKIILLTNGQSSLTENQALKLKRHKVEIIEKKIIEIKHHQGKIERVSFGNTDGLDIPVMYAGIPFKQHCTFAEKLGCEISEDGFIRVDEFKKTSVHGVYAAGDNTSNSRTISRAVSAGTIAGMMLNGEMSLESF